MSIGLKVLNFVNRHKPMKVLASPSAAGLAATAIIISNLSKDGVNCYYYVSQSLKNKKIPEEKRKFVAALDLSNGLLNITVMTAFGILITKPIKMFFDKVIAPKHFSQRIIQQKYKELKNIPKLANLVSLDKIEGAIKRNSKNARTGLEVITTLVVTQIVAKRIIVPLIATPMASFFKKKMEKGAGAKTATATPNTTPVVNNSKTNVKNTPDCFKNFQ